MGWLHDGAWDRATARPGVSTGEIAVVMAQIARAINQRRSLGLSWMSQVAWPLDEGGELTSTEPEAADWGAGIYLRSEFVRDFLVLARSSINAMIPETMRGAAPAEDGAWDVWGFGGVDDFWDEAEDGLGDWSPELSPMWANNWLILKRALDMMVAFRQPFATRTTTATRTRRRNVVNQSKAKAFLCSSIAEIASDGDEDEQVFTGASGVTVGAEILGWHVWHQHTSGAWGWSANYVEPYEGDDEQHGGPCELESDDVWEEDNGAEAEQENPNFSLKPDPEDCYDVVNPYTEITHREHRGRGAVYTAGIFESTWDFATLVGQVFTQRTDGKFDTGLKLRVFVQVEDSVHRAAPATIIPVVPAAKPWPAVDIVEGLRGEWTVTAGGEGLGTVTGPEPESGEVFTEKMETFDISALAGGSGAVVMEYTDDLAPTGESPSFLSYEAAVGFVGGGASGKQLATGQLSVGRPAINVSALLDDQI